MYLNRLNDVELAEQLLEGTGYKVSKEKLNEAISGKRLMDANEDYLGSLITEGYHGDVLMYALMAFGGINIFGKESERLFNRVANRYGGEDDFIAKVAEALAEENFNVGKHFSDSCCN